MTSPSLRETLISVLQRYEQETGQAIIHILIERIPDSQFHFIIRETDKAKKIGRDSGLRKNI